MRYAGYNTLKSTSSKLGWFCMRSDEAQTSRYLVLFRGQRNESGN